MIATAAETYGKIDGVANCVGSIVLKGAHQTSDDEFNKTIALNLNSSFYVLRWGRDSAGAGLGVLWAWRLLMPAPHSRILVSRDAASGIWTEPHSICTGPVLTAIDPTRYRCMLMTHTGQR